MKSQNSLGKVTVGTIPYFWVLALTLYGFMCDNCFKKWRSSTSSKSNFRQVLFCSFRLRRRKALLEGMETYYDVSVNDTASFIVDIHKAEARNKRLREVGHAVFRLLLNLLCCSTLYIGYSPVSLLIPYIMAVRVHFKRELVTKGLTL